MSYTNVTRISIAGRPTFEVPAGFTVERVLETMSINVADYETEVVGSTLTLSLPTGSKGALDEVRILESGRLVPYGNTTFPTDADIDLIAEMDEFKDDNLLLTLKDPAELVKYAAAIAASAGTREAAHKAKRDEARAAELAKADEALAYLTKVATGEGDFADEVFLNTLVKLQGVFELADYVESVQVLEIKAAQAKAEDEALRAQVRG